MRGWPPHRWGSPTVDWEYGQAYPDETPEGKLSSGDPYLLRRLRYDLNGSARWVSPSHLASWWNFPITAWKPLYPCLGEDCGTGRYCSNCALLIHWLAAAPKLELPVKALVSAASLRLRRSFPSPEVVTPAHPAPFLGCRGGRCPGKGFTSCGGGALGHRLHICSRSRRRSYQD